MMTGNEHILIIDDEIPICQIMRKILSSNNYRVAEAHTGKEALEKFAQQDFDLILLDLMLPDANGIDVAKEMMKNMDPEDMKDLMKQAQSQQGQMEDNIKRIVQEEIQKQNLITKEDLDKAISRLKQ